MSHELVDGRFRIGRVVGKGTVGEVHRAEDLQAAQGSPERAVAVTAILRRRNRTRLIAGGIAADGSELPYLAMEFLDGETPRDLIEEEPQLPLARAAAIGAQIADGRSAAHTAGVVHRDLKPSDVMLTQGGTVKVLDFGMGRIVDDPDEARLTSTGVSVGTARYMAPEQFEAKQVTQAADLCALGCMLYEIPVGVPPFRRKDETTYGSYRTKELILAEYDRMAEAGLTFDRPLVDSENYTSTRTPHPGHGPRHERAGE